MEANEAYRRFLEESVPLNTEVAEKEAAREKQREIEEHLEELRAKNQVWEDELAQKRFERLDRERISRKNKLEEQEKREKPIEKESYYTKLVYFQGKWEHKTKHYTVNWVCTRCGKATHVGDWVRYAVPYRDNCVYLCKKCMGDLEKVMGEKTT